MALGLAKAISMFGMSGRVVQVEAEVGNGLPGFSLIGLPDNALSESKERVKSAVQNIGLKWPQRKLTVNLSPAALKKFGSGFDLAIAIAVLATGYRFRNFSVKNTLFIGELGLDGKIRPIGGVLAGLLEAAKNGIKRAYVPTDNLGETRLIDQLEIIPVANLTDLVEKLGIEVKLRKFQSADPSVETNAIEENLNIELAASSNDQRYRPDFNEVRGQGTLIRGLTIAAAGGHHVLLVGPPGSGKTMMAQRFAGILPKLTVDQALESAALTTLTGRPTLLATPTSEIFDPPFSAPHHNASVSAMVGGGSPIPAPGAISLAHNGVLFLDEACEFQIPVLESLRQPLESGSVSIIRAAGVASFPANFQLVLAANPCPCGYALGGLKRCECNHAQKVRYRSKLSGPLLDRVDIRLRVGAPGSSEVSKGSSELAEQVIQARNRALSRYKSENWTHNSAVPGQILQQRYPIGKSVKLLDAARNSGKLSMRGFERAYKLSWTIADLNGHDQPTLEDVSEALYFRGSDSPLDPSSE